MNFKEIVKKYLEENGFEGIYCDDGDCACSLDDLMPCEGVHPTCSPGYKVPCNPETCTVGGQCDWHISPEKDGDTGHPNDLLTVEPEELSGEEKNV